MDIYSTTKIRIKSIEEKIFTCPICDKKSYPQYNIVINDGDLIYHMCLDCHNNIASKLSFIKDIKKFNYFKRGVIHEQRLIKEIKKEYEFLFKASGG